ncbi:hypothetical protein [Aldersonia kunmingensis]|uniref:hypothetical protein n=1 Tax=Aldersonia kunmingensis TaxID=408066 RepID=UPI000829D36A|nr:hypothetical protein [Aldersonia kunmingensis]
MTKPDDARLQKKLKEQLGFLRRSARDFDGGDEEEALRLATTMRVLFHDTSSSTSLLTHLSIRHETTMLATPPTQFADWRDFLNVSIDLNSSEPVRFLPKLGGLFIPDVPLEDWWATDSIAASETAVSRKRIILGAANRDGGAHVDTKLQNFYEHLVKGEYGLGITGDLTFDGPAPFPQGVTIYPRNGHLAFLRQFAHEVLNAANHYHWIHP